MHKCITQREIDNILRTYSIRENEFLPIEGKEYCYKSQILKGYTITISLRKESRTRDGEILVTHTQWNGRKTFHDIWLRDYGSLRFRFRNLSDEPPSYNWAYIRESDEKIKQLSLRITELEKQSLSVQEMSQQSELPIDGTINEAAYRQMQERIKLLEEENQLLKEKTKHNARGAGRKPSSNRSDAIRQLNELICLGYNEKEIIEKLGISRTTFFRYKKELKDNS